MTTAVKTSLLALVELRAIDPEATSALQVARARLEAGRGLVSLRRWRAFELRGETGSREQALARLHRSTQFYNPSKERCSVLDPASAESPFCAGEVAVLVFERGGERRGAAERWWRHDGGGRVEVREGIVWVMRWDDGIADAARAESLAVTTSRESGLLCNPHAQEWRSLAAGDAPPSDWISRRASSRGGKGKAS